MEMEMKSDDSNYSLFAIMNNSVATGISIITMSASTQKKVTGMLNQQLSVFNSHYDREIEYCAGYTPSQSEIFTIENFIDCKELYDYISGEKKATIFNPKKHSAENIKCFFAGNSKTIMLQNFDKKHVLNVNKTLFLSNDVFELSTSIGLSLPDKLAGVVTGNKIRFKSFQNLRKIFNMDKYFREATVEELNTFVAHDKFHKEPGFDITKVSDTEILTKVALISKINTMDHPITLMKKYAKQVDFKLITTIDSSGKEKVVMPTDKKEIKLLLSFLNEDIFKSIMSKQTYKSNSKRPI